MLLLGTPRGKLLLQFLPHAFIHILKLFQGVCKRARQKKTEVSNLIMYIGPTGLLHTNAYEHALLLTRMFLKKGSADAASEKPIR